MNSIIINIDNTADINIIYNQLKKQYPKFEIIKERKITDMPENLFIDTHNPDGTPKRTGTHEEFMKEMRELAGSIDDPSFVEQSEIEYESPREPII